MLKSYSILDRIYEWGGFTVHVTEGKSYARVTKRAKSKVIPIINVNINEILNIDKLSGKVTIAKETILAVTAK